MAKRGSWLLPKNISIVRRVKSNTDDGTKKSDVENSKEVGQPKVDCAVEHSTVNSSTSSSSNGLPDNIVSKAMKILEDPEINAMIEQEPRVKVAIEDCLANPMNFMKYITDPSLSPFISKAMSKL